MAEESIIKNSNDFEVTEPAKITLTVSIFSSVSNSVTTSSTGISGKALKAAMLNRRSLTSYTL